MSHSADSRPLFSQAPSVLYFYGLAGAGKNFVGDIMGQLTGWHVYHADVDLTQEIHLAIAEKRPFAPEMRDRYYAIVAERILELRHHHEHVIVTQATYKAHHRNYLMSKISDMDMICVVADDTTIMERLQKRGDVITPAYAAIMRAGFEPPAVGSKIIVNDAGESEIILQLNKLYPSRPERNPILKMDEQAQP